MSTNTTPDADRIDCPFCGHMHYPGSETADEEDWSWADDVCDHLLFLALDLSSYTGFQYRSDLFNRHLGLSDPLAEVEIPSPEDPAENLSVDEIISKLKAEIPGLELRSYDDGGGMACGPIPGGTVTFGFVPQGANA
jgi:hypothetical protein